MAKEYTDPLTFGLKGVSVFVIMLTAASLFLTTPPICVKSPPTYNMLLYKYKDLTVPLTPKPESLSDIIPNALTCAKPALVESP